MENGINVLTSGYNIKVEGAEELILEWEQGKLTKEELTERLMNLETVLVDLTKVVDPSEFKDSEE